MAEWSDLQKWRDESESNYNRAISYYNNLKLQFFNELKNNSQKELADDFFKSFINDLNKDLVAQEDSFIKENDPELEKMYKEILEMVETYYRYHLFNNGIVNTKATIQKIKEKANDTKYSDKLDNILDRTNKELRSLYEGNITIKEEMKIIFGKFFGVNAPASQASLNGMFGMLRRAILDRFAENSRISNEIIKNSRMTGYKKLFRGYYSEVLKTQIVNNTLEGLRSRFSAQQTGEKTNSNGVQTEYDIILGTFKGTQNLDKAIQNAIDSMDITRGSGIGEAEFYTDAEIELMSSELAKSRLGYGIQSKLWILPDDLKNTGKKISDQFYMIGSRANLHNSIGGGVLNNSDKYDPTWKRGWSYNILLLSRYLITVLGQSQLMYATKDKFIWMGDLIQQMRRNNLYVSFYYKRDKGDFIYPSTSDVVWDYSRLGYRKHMQAVARAKNK